MQRLEVSGAVRPIYGSLGVKRLNNIFFVLLSHLTRVRILCVLLDVAMSTYISDKSIFPDM